MATKGRLIRREETRARAESFAAQRAIPARADLSSRTRWTSRSDGGARGRRGEGAGVIAERCPRNAAETHRSRVASCRRLFRDETRGPPCSAIKSMPSRGWLPSTLLYVRCDSSTPPPPRALPAMLAEHDASPSSCRASSMDDDCANRAWKIGRREAES